MYEFIDVGQCQKHISVLGHTGYLDIYRTLATGEEITYNKHGEHWIYI